MSNNTGSLCGRIRLACKIKYMIHRKKIKINGHCGIFCKYLICGRGSSALKQKNASIMNARQEAQKNPFPPPDI